VLEYTNLSTYKTEKMKKTIEKLIYNTGQLTNDKRGFLSIKGGFSVMSVSTNAACTNSGDTCSGTNTGNCTNPGQTVCMGTTNTGECYNSRCFPL